MTETNKPKQLELFYMMNVSLYLENKYDAFRFIQINKKCEQSLIALKNTPFPFDAISTEWFSHHFNPDTIDRKEEMTTIQESDRKAKIIRYPNYRIENNANEIVDLFPKISHLTINYKYFKKLDEFVELIYEYSDRFTNLQEIRGYLIDMIKFFKSYTKEGTEMNVPFPKKIVILEFDDKKTKTVLDENYVKKISEMKKYIRKENETQIICYLDEYSNRKGKKLQRSKELSDIQWVYKGVPSQHLKNDDLNKNNKNKSIPINDIRGNTMNKWIEKYYPFSFSYFPNDKQSNYLEEKEIWNPPECVKSLKILRYFFSPDAITKEMKEEIKSESIKKMIEDRKYRLFIDMSTIETLFLYFNSNLRFNHSFDQLKELNIKICNDCYFEEYDGKSISFPQLEKLNLFQTIGIYINIDAPRIQCIYLIVCDDIQIRGNIQTVQRLEILISRYITIEWMDISNKNVKIQNCKSIKFMKGNEILVPFSSEIMSLNEFNDCCIFNCEYPNVLMNKEIEYLFKCQPFQSIWYDVAKYNKDNQQIVTKNDFKDFFVNDMCIDSKFFCIKGYLKMEIMTSEGKKIIPADVRYFEVKLFDYTNIQIGIKSKNFLLSLFMNDLKEKQVSYSSLTGDINMDGKHYSTEANHKLYCDEYVIGCGYDLRNKNVFFTKNGVKFWENEFLNGLNKKDISKYEEIFNAYIDIKYFNRIEINTGSKPFMYDLEQEYINENEI